MNSPKTYTAKDIERYHRGEMSAAEMHLLEKTALDDPALADMLEGYALTSTSSADLQNLHKRLQQRINEEKKGGGVIFGQPWLRIAALFVLIAGGGWLVFQTFSSNDNSQAKKNGSDSATITANKTLRQTDSVALVMQATPARPTDSQEQNNDAVAMERGTEKAPRPKTKKPAAAQLSPTDNVTAGTETVNTASTLGLLKAEEKREDSTAVAGSVAGRNPAPAARSMNDTIRDVNIVLKRNNLPVEDVVINKTKQAQVRRRQATVVIDTLEPQHGWLTFDDYIAENLHAPEELKAKPSSNGIVELRFRVDKDGNPTNITVTQSLCEKCDAEAIRLLKEGPKWKGKKGTIKIRFPQSP